MDDRSDKTEGGELAQNLTERALFGIRCFERAETHHIASFLSLFTLLIYAALYDQAAHALALLLLFTLSADHSFTIMIITAKQNNGGELSYYKNPIMRRLWA